MVCSMIVNKRNEIRLASQIKVANNAWSRMVGLIGQRNLDDNKAILIYPCQQIHTFFMSFPIDCLFINKEYQVLQCIESLNPWKVSKKVPGAWAVIELPSGVIQRTNTRVDDFLKIAMEQGGK